LSILTLYRHFVKENFLKKIVKNIDNFAGLQYYVMELCSPNTVPPFGPANSAAWLSHGNRTAAEWSIL